MKCTVILVLFAVCGALALPTHDPKVAEHDFLVKQKDVLRLLMHMYQPNTFHDQIEISKTWKIEDHLDKFTNTQVIKDFIKQYNFGLLPHGEIFSILDSVHRHQAVALFKVFYDAKDWETFYKCACWARNHINEGMFVYTFVVAINHRHDCEGLIVPPMYEINPYYFINNDAIEKAIDYKTRGWTGVKMQNDVCIIPYNYTGWYKVVNSDQKISYLMEDVGWNLYYYNTHTDYPFWMGGEEYGLNKDRRGEFMLTIYNQILARYYMERLSNGLGSIEFVDFVKHWKTGFYPSLRFHNGLDFISRPFHANLIKDDYSKVIAEEIETLEIRLSNVIDSGFIFSKEGKLVKLDTEHGIELLGKLIDGNPDSLNPRLYGKIVHYWRMLLGFSTLPHNRYHLHPGTMELYETALRDPAFYRIMKKMLFYVQKYKKTLPRYTYTDMNFPGVKVDHVVVDKLITYYDHFDVDVTNALNTDMKLEADKETIRVKVRQMRLNHKPYTYKVTVTSEKDTRAVVRVFLAPKYDEFGRVINIHENRVNYMYVDYFLADLKTGENVLERNSKQNFVGIKDRTSFMDLYRKVMTALEGGEKFLLDHTDCHCGFPQRLLLPKGTKGGMTFRWFVMVSPLENEIKKTYDPRITCGVGTGTRFVDSRPFRFPFDRPISEYQFYTPNMVFQDVHIFHRREEDVNKVIADV